MAIMKVKENGVWKKVTSPISTHTITKDELEAGIQETLDNSASKEYVNEVISGLSIDQVNPDWNQNDETAADYVKNRTHYDEVIFEGEFFNEQVTYKTSNMYSDLPYYYSFIDFEVDRLYTNAQFSLTVTHNAYSSETKQIVSGARYNTTIGPTRTFIINIQSIYTGVKYIISIGIYSSHNSSENIILSDLVISNTIAEKYIPNTIARTKDIETALLPEVTESDNGAFLRVVNGTWSVETIANAEEVSF